MHRSSRANISQTIDGPVHRGGNLGRARSLHWAMAGSSETDFDDALRIFWSVSVSPSIDGRKPTSDSRNRWIIFVAIQRKIVIVVISTNGLTKDLRALIYLRTEI